MRLRLFILPALLGTLLACASGAGTERRPAVEARPAVAPEPARTEESPASAGPSTQVEAAQAAAAVSLQSLLEAARRRSAADVTTALGGLRLWVQCTSDGWQTDASGQLESQSCPAGRVIMGEARARIEVRITRRRDDPSASRADIVLIGETESNDEWLAQVRRALDAQLDEVTRLENDRSRTTYDLVGDVSALVVEPTAGSPPALHLFRPGRSTPR